MMKIMRQLKILMTKEIEEWNSFIEYLKQPKVEIEFDENDKLLKAVL